jgi:hypothetical protein
MSDFFRKLQSGVLSHKNGICNYCHYCNIECPPNRDCFEQVLDFVLEEFPTDIMIPQLEPGDVIHTRLSGKRVKYKVYCLDPKEPDTYIVYSSLEKVSQYTPMIWYQIKEDPDVYKITRLDENLKYKRIWIDYDRVQYTKADEADCRTLE